MTVYGNESGTAVPAFLSAFLKEQYGESASIIEEGYRARRPVTLRVNLLKTDFESAERILSDEFQTERTPVPFSLIVKNADEETVAKTDLYREGKIYLQSLSSMIPPFLLAPKEGENILDMAAAPGGKTSEISALSGGKCFLTACEKDKIRFDRLTYNLKKQGVPRVNAIHADALKLDEFFRFDKILLDAPCSGSGTLSPDTPCKISEALVKNSAVLQEKLLKKALSLVKCNSLVVYSTCSVLRQENEEIIEKVLKTGTCELAPLELPFEVPRLKSMENTLLIPPTDLYEGFFSAVLRKK